MADAAAAETATTETTQTSETTSTETTETETVEERLAKAEAEAEKWKTQSRKNEERAKENKKARDELDELHKASLSDSDRAIAEAKEAGRAEAIQTVGSRLVDAEFRVAAAGRTLDVDALLEGLDRTRFLTDDGDPDKDQITAWVEKIAPEPAETTQQQSPLGGLDLGQGSRPSPTNGSTDEFVRHVAQAVGVPPK